MAVRPPEQVIEVAATPGRVDRVKKGDVLAAGSLTGPAAPGDAEVRRWIGLRKPGHALPGGFYHEPCVYAADVARVWSAGWLFVGHTCEIPDEGSYRVVTVDRMSVVVVRSSGGQFRAFHNVCRHRGSLVCTSESGRAGRLVCPYHQWAYDLEGRLAGCRGMPEDFDRERHGLKPVAVRDVAGLLFINLTAAASTFDGAAAALEPFLRPQGLENARVAHAAEYRVRSNWKVVWENNRECYHCNSNHPEYIRANFDHYNEDDTTPEIAARMASESARMQAKWAAAGLAPTHCRTGMTRFPDAAAGIWYSANRTLLVEGWVSETADGRQVAPLMGQYLEPDVGTLRVRGLPNLWMHGSCDHAVTTRLLPVDAETTAIRVVWLVNSRAIEGADYNLEDLLTFWKQTSEQDWRICEHQQLGIRSPAYEPGPYSPSKEYNVDAFVCWYLEQLAGGGRS